MSAADVQDWHDDAACRAPGVDPRLFYADADDTDATSQEQIRAARAICRQCPVSAECLAEAQRLVDQHGVWGGLVPEERKALRLGRADVTADGHLVRRCTECGGAFAWTTTRWLCSDACEEAQAAREASRRAGSRQCVECGQGFDARASQLVCSRRCANERERRRQAERPARSSSRRSRRCAVCNGGLSSGQDRVCSPQCASVYGSAGRGRPARWAS